MGACQVSFPSEKNKALSRDTGSRRKRSRLKVSLHRLRCLRRRRAGPIEASGPMARPSPDCATAASGPNPGSGTVEPLWRRQNAAMPGPIVCGGAVGPCRQRRQRRRQSAAAVQVGPRPPAAAAAVQGPVAGSGAGGGCGGGLASGWAGILRLAYDTVCVGHCMCGRGGSRIASTTT